MSAPILIFSADAVRGNVLMKVLQQSNFDILLYNKIVKAENIIKKNNPSVVILDIKTFFSKEVEYLRKGLLFVESMFIVLAEPSASYAFGLDSTSNIQFLPDPIDPELLVSKITELFSSKDKENYLENDLKHLLNLE